MCGENKDLCGMRKEKIILEDGRYLVYYWFGKGGKKCADGHGRKDGDVRASDERDEKSESGGGKN